MLRQFTSRWTLRIAAITTAAAVAIATPAVQAQDSLPPASPPGAPSAESAPSDSGVLTHESLKERLVGLGYEPAVQESTTGTPIYTLDFQQGNFRYIINVALSSDGKLLFLDAPLKIFQDPTTVPSERLLRLFEENTAISPMAFRYDKVYKQLYLTHAIANEGFTPTRLRKVIGDLMQTTSNTQPLWNPSHWKSPEAAESAAAVQVDPASDLGLMQGKWSVTSAVVQGKEVPAENLKQFEVAIVGQKLTLMNVDFQIELDPASSPKTIDNVLIGAGTREVGIYELSGDSLTLSMAVVGHDRPADFAAGEGVTLIRLTRQAEGVATK